MVYHECEHCECAILFECDEFRLEGVRLMHVWKLYKNYGQKKEPVSRRWGCDVGDDDGAQELR